MDAITGNKELFGTLKAQQLGGLKFDTELVITSANRITRWGEVSVALGVMFMVIGLPVWALKSLFAGGSMYGTGLLLVAGGRAMAYLASIERNTRILTERLEKIRCMGLGFSWKSAMGKVNYEPVLDGQSVVQNRY